MQNIGSDLIRGNIDTIILKTMLDGDKYGLDIIKEVESRSNGTYELKQPTLYSCLKRLENQELISSYWLDSDIGGRRHYYKLTEKGRDFYEKKQEEWAKSKFIIDNLLSNFNYDEYRLVKKDDYDKIIENKQPEYDSNSPLTSSTQDNVSMQEETNISDAEYSQEPEVVVLPNDNSPAELDDEEEIETEEELGVDLNENLEDSNIDGDDEFETTNLDSDIEDFNNIDDEDSSLVAETDDGQTPSQETQKSERKYFVNIDDETEEDAQVASYEEKDYSASESNILSILRKQDDEINTYVGDHNSYINHLNQTEPDSLDDAEVIQDSLLDLADENSNTLENKINEFEEAVENLNNFECSYDEVEETDLDETFDEIDEEDDSFNSVEGIELLEPEDDTYIQKSIYGDEVYTEPDEQDHIDFSTNDDLVYSNAFESVKPETKCACEYVDDFDDLNELNNKTNSSFLMDTDDVDYSKVQIQKQYSPEPYYVQDNNLTDSSDAAFDFSEETEDVNDFFPTIDAEEVETEQSFDDVSETEEDFEEISFAQPEDTNVYENVNNNLSNYSFDDIISKNITSSAETITSNYVSNDVFTPSYTGSNYKEKLSNLSAYSKNTTEETKVTETEATRKAKDIASLKEELEQEGIKIKEYKKYGANEQAEKSYLLVNKINLINSLILLFGYVFILSAVYIILNNTAFKDTFGFNFKYFVFGFIPFIAIALYHGIKFIINPYKKVPAKYAPRIMIFISVIITIQLLLITYCVNLQLGFYSFTQSGYNHLIWLVPTIVSFAPILYTTVYMALFYSKNFNV